MRLLYVSHSFPVPDQPLSNVGGMQRVAVDLFRALEADPDVEVRPVVLETSWRWTGARTPPFLVSLLRRIPKLVANEPIDAVLFSSMVTAGVVPLLRERLRMAGVLTAAIPVGRDVTLPNPIYQRLVPRVLRSLDLVLPISRATAAECVARGADPERVHVIPCGTEMLAAGGERDRPRARSTVLEMLRSRGIDPPSDPLLLLSVGRHQERKGFHWFVEEVMTAAPPNAVYVLAGSGPMTERIQATIKEKSLTTRVALLGQVDQATLETLYAGADLFIMPNVPVAGDIEGFGVVMVEAGAAGLPVIAADLEGIRDVVAAGENGVLVPTRDVAGFVAGIRGFEDRAKLEDASNRAQRYCRSRFTWSSIARRHVEVIGARLAASAEEPASAPKYG
jgi:phosphatidyl-myo-inositol dimannoside synthase